MTHSRILLAAVLCGAAAPASAQLSNRSIAVESGFSAALEGAGGTGAALALVATAWLEGDLEAVARVSVRAGPRTDDRAADGAWSGTAGLRLSLLPEPLRPQVSAEVGWARAGGPAGSADRLVVGAGVGLEWFAARDVAVSARCAVRGVGAAPSLDVVLGAAAYF